MLINAEEVESIQRVRIVRGAPSVSHLLFADDFIFYQATLKEAREIKFLLEDYCNILGSLINYYKSAIYFSEGFCEKRCRYIASLPGMRLMDKNEKYLGNPLAIKDKTLSFELY